MLCEPIVVNTKQLFSLVTLFAHRCTRWISEHLVMHLWPVVQAWRRRPPAAAQSVSHRAEGTRVTLPTTAREPRPFPIAPIVALAPLYVWRLHTSSRHMFASSSSSLFNILYPLQRRIRFGRLIECLRTIYYLPPLVFVRDSSSCVFTQHKSLFIVEVRVFTSVLLV